MNRLLKVLRVLLRTLLILAGALLVLTGLSSLPRLFLGIGVVILGIVAHQGFTLLLRDRENPGWRTAPDRPKRERNPLAWLVRQPEVPILLFAFLLNFVWEVSQIPFYTGINRGRPYFGENTVAMKSFFVATFWRASFLDALLVLGAFLIAAQLYGSRYWFVRGGRLLGGAGRPAMKPWIGYLIVTAVCVFFLVYLEISAFDSGLWGYSEIMPTLFRKIGVVPVFALLWTPSAVLLLARRFYLGQAFRAGRTELGLRPEDLKDAGKASRAVARYRDLGGD